MIRWVSHKKHLGTFSWKGLRSINNLKLKGLKKELVNQDIIPDQRKKTGRLTHVLCVPTRIEQLIYAVVSMA